MMGPLVLRLAVEELDIIADSEIEEDRLVIVVGGSMTLEALLVLVGVLEVGRLLLDGSAALILTVLL